MRFSAKNPFDFLLWDSKRHILYALEAKTVSGKSISFERDKEDKGVIHIHQINGLNSWNKYDGITCGLLIEFRELEKTIFLDIEDMNQVMARLVRMVIGAVPHGGKIALLHKSVKIFEESFPSHQRDQALRIVGNEP